MTTIVSRFFNASVLRLFVLVFSLVLGGVNCTTPQPLDASTMAKAVAGLTRETSWTLKTTLPLRFDAHHPQGLAMVGDAFFLSAVERSKKAGHLFRFNRQGELTGHILFNRLPRIHPGGIDTDGTHIWLPLAAYRPDGKTSILKIDAKTLKYKEAFHVSTHVGALAFDAASKDLFVADWGARHLLRYSTSGVALRMIKNPSQFVDYQDCQGVGAGYVLCGGYSPFEPRLVPNSAKRTIDVGGLALVNIDNFVLSQELPLPLYTPAGNSVARNALCAKYVGNKVMLHAVADDGRSALLIYESSSPSR